MHNGTYLLLPSSVSSDPQMLVDWGANLDYMHGSDPVSVRLESLRGNLLNQSNQFLWP